MPRSKRLLPIVCLALLLIVAALVWWAPWQPRRTLVAIVSEQNAAQLVEAGRIYHQTHPKVQLRFRTTAQVETMSDAQLAQLLDGADAVFLATVFNSTAQRLMPLLGEHGPGSVLAVSSSPELGMRSRWHGQRLFADHDPLYTAVSSAKNDTASDAAWVKQASTQHPALAPWIHVRGYWQNRNADNLAALFDALASGMLGPVEDIAAIRTRVDGRWQPLADFVPSRKQRIVAILDHERADRAGDVAVLDVLCAALAQQQLQCLPVLARWGKASSDALQLLHTKLQPDGAPGRLAALVSLQDFVIGGSSDRKAASDALVDLGVPVLKGIRVHDMEESAWHLSEQGLPRDSVYYRIAMPELQGIGQALVVAAAQPPQADPLTGIQVALVQPVPAQIEHLAARAANWAKLQDKANADKRVAIVYYNHPPGRHNIGADNLDVPASLLQILRELKAHGYDTGSKPLPATPEALLELLQRDGINLPEQGDALTDMAKRVTTMPASDYANWFATLPAGMRDEMVDGPLARLHDDVAAALAARHPELAQARIERTLRELGHILEGTRHPSRERALDLFAQLRKAYAHSVANGHLGDNVKALDDAIIATGIEGLRGWGKPPGRIMVVGDRLVLPGLHFGKIFIGPQPPRGWELNEELLHANTSLPPTHDYLAFYHYLHDEFRADAVIHLGRHSTYEFLPRKSIGLDEDDYPLLIAGDVPGIYPYIVDGVGEGLQAKRRGLAVMIDHLTPPLSTTPLYDKLLQLRQLVESFEASSDPATRTQAVKAMRKTIDALHLRDALIASMGDELKLRGVSFEQADDELIVHELGHYLTRLQEQFMPLGLHVFGKDWDDASLRTMLASMDKADDANARAALAASPASERNALLAALSGRYVLPGPGNDPIRDPDALPTGRNFHGLDSSLLPTRLGYQQGEQMAVDARPRIKPDGKEAVILWASDAVRDEGALVGFGMALLGIEPDWNSRGIVHGLKRLPLAANGQRADTLFVSSGLFRDLFGQQIEWLDKAALLAIDGSTNTIAQQHPELSPALTAALAPLGPLADPGNEPLDRNHIARHWVSEVQELLKQGEPADKAGREASLRVFGTAPGDYGAGINRLAERSGSWTDRKELGATYVTRMGHAYGVGLEGMPEHALLENQLRHVDNTYLGRASNLYGLIDNNDAFDYLGGLSLAVETLTGKVPSNHVIEHPDAEHIRTVPLQTALLTELHGRYLNPAWIKPLMQHGYAGARTMGSEFVEYLWGWQVTNPDIIQSSAWDQVNAVYLDDSEHLGLDTFLEHGSNVHVKTSMMAILMVAAQKGFWKPDSATLDRVAQHWADLLIAHGLPGSGHSRPDHPVFTWVMPHLRADQRVALRKVLDRAAAQPVAQAANGKAAPQGQPTTITEIQPARSSNAPHRMMLAGLIALFVGLVLLGLWRGRRA